MPTVLVASKIGTKMKKQRVCKTNSLSKMNKEEERIRRIKQARINQIKEIELVIEWLIEWVHPYKKGCREWMVHFFTRKLDKITK